MKREKITDHTLLSGDELEALLREEVDDAAVQAILDELARRQPMSGDAIDQAWKAFTTHYLPIQGADSIYSDEPLEKAPKVRPFRLRRTAGAAVVAAAAVCMLVVQAGGTKGLATMARWTVDSFSFSDTLVFGERSLLPEAGSADAAKAASSAAPGAAGEEKLAAASLEGGDVYFVEDGELETVSYDSFSGAVKAFGGETLLPSAIPAGYAFESAEITNSYGWKDLQVCYTNGDGRLLRFDYTRISPGTVMSTVVEKDDTPVEVYEREGTTYYFVTNLAYESVNWKSDEWTECRISGYISRETLRDMIDSMYE